MDKDELRETFNHFDADHNGHIDVAEFARLMRTLDASISEDEIEMGFVIIDEDGNGTIEFDEFCAWWSER